MCLSVYLHVCVHACVWERVCVCVCIAPCATLQQKAHVHFACIKGQVCQKRRLKEVSSGLFWIGLFQRSLFVATYPNPKRLFSHTSAYARAHTHTHKCTLTHSHTHTHTHTHTHVHTHTHTHTHTPVCVALSRPTSIPVMRHMTHSYCNF